MQPRPDAVDRGHRLTIHARPGPEYVRGWASLVFYMRTELAGLPACRQDGRGHSVRLAARQGHAQPGPEPGGQGLDGLETGAGVRV